MVTDSDSDDGEALPESVSDCGDDDDALPELEPTRNQSTQSEIRGKCSACAALSLIRREAMIRRARDAGRTNDDGHQDHEELPDLEESKRND